MKKFVQQSNGTKTNGSSIKTNGVSNGNGKLSKNDKKRIEEEKKFVFQVYILNKFKGPLLTQAIFRKF